jgi:O-acetyl-ADP-ribose deacetylase (regulator of RNase III)
MINVSRGDITLYTGDCIVNAANSALCGGGGVDGAIHRAAGPGLLAECRKMGGCKTGDVKISGSYNLNVKKIIHAVGPVWSGGDHGEDELLESCYRRSLNLCVDHGLRSIAFPNISCGAYKFPIDRACAIAVSSVCDWLKGNLGCIEEVAVVCFEVKLQKAMIRAVRKYTGN